MSSFSIVVTLQLTILMQWKHSLSIVITLQLTIFMQLKCSFSIVIIFNCCHFATDHPHAVKTLIVSLFVQVTKFKSYMSSYHPMQKVSNWKSGLNMERWLTSWRTSTHERPFTQEGNYLVIQCHFTICSGHFAHCVIPLLRGSHPLPHQLPGEHTGLPSHTRQYLYHSACSMRHSLTHSLMADRRTVVRHVPMDHMCSFMCTSHIDMTAHTPAFLQVG